MNQVVWGPIGTMFNEPVSASQAIVECGADFQVGMQPVAALSPDIMGMLGRGEAIPPSMLEAALIAGTKATMRLDNNGTLGVVSDKYGVVQNQHAFDFVDQLTTGVVGSDKPTIVAAGSIFGGRKTFITAKFPEPIRLAGKDDIVDMYCVFVTSHDGTGAVTCMMTPIRVWCNNMINIASKSCASKIALRHSRFVAERLDLDNKDNAERAYKTLNLYNTYREFFEVETAKLASKMISDAQMRDIVAKIALPEESYDIFKKTGNILHEEISTRSKNLATGLIDSIYSGVGQREAKSGTALWVLNGITTHYQNTVNWNNKDEKKFESITEGNVYKKMQEAYDILAAA